MLKTYLTLAYFIGFSTPGVGGRAAFCHAWAGRRGWCRRPATWMAWNRAASRNICRCPAALASRSGALKRSSFDDEKVGKITGGAIIRPWPLPRRSVEEPRLAPRGGGVT